VLRNPLVAVHSIFWHETEVAGRKLGVTLQPRTSRRRSRLPNAKQGNAQALLAFDDALTLTYKHRIVAVATSNDLPTMYRVS
jgi:hypothetical protein